MSVRDSIRRTCSKRCHSFRIAMVLGSTGMNGDGIYSSMARYLVTVYIQVWHATYIPRRGFVLTASMLLPIRLSNTVLYVDVVVKYGMVLSC